VSTVHVPVKRRLEFICLLQMVVVDASVAASGMATNEFVVIQDADHYSVCKPEADWDNRFRLLVRFIEENLGMRTEMTEDRVNLQ
jgi:hypothetical protein